LRLRYRAINADGNASRSARRQRPPRWRQSRSTVEQRQISAAVARGPTSRCFMSVPIIKLPPGVDQTLPHLWGALPGGGIEHRYISLSYPFRQWK